MALGPAINGIATGTINGSPSISSSTSFPPVPGKIMFRAIKKRITPPDIRKISSDRFRALKNISPKKRNPTKTRKAMRHSRKITSGRRSLGTCLKDAIKRGIFPKGSVIRMSRIVMERKLCLIAFSFSLLDSYSQSYQQNRLLAS